MTVNRTFKVRQAAHIQRAVKPLEDRHIDVRPVKVQVKVSRISDCSFYAERATIWEVRAKVVNRQVVVCEIKRGVRVVDVQTFKVQTRCARVAVDFKLCKPFAIAVNAHVRRDLAINNLIGAAELTKRRRVDSISFDVCIKGKVRGFDFDVARDVAAEDIRFGVVKVNHFADVTELSGNVLRGEVFITEPRGINIGVDLRISSSADEVRPNISRALNAYVIYDCCGCEAVRLGVDVKKSFVGVEANLAACRGVLPVRRRGGVQNDFAFVKGHSAVNVFNVGLFNLDGRAFNFCRTKISQSIVAAQEVQRKIFRRAADNLHAFRDFICGQIRQELIKKNFVDSGIDDLLSRAERARGVDLCAESFCIELGGDCVHVHAIGFGGDFLDRNIFPVKVRINRAACH